MSRVGFLYSCETHEKLFIVIVNCLPYRVGNGKSKPNKDGVEYFIMVLLSFLDQANQDSSRIFEFTTDSSWFSIKYKQTLLGLLDFIS